MRTFSGQDIVRLWENTARQHPLDRALTVLMTVYPEVSRVQLAKLNIGQRDAYLFALREYLFGARLHSMATCPFCGQQLEFTLNTANLPVSAGMATVNDVYALAEGDSEVRFRLPDSLDLAAITGCKDVAEARSSLVRRCVVSASRAGSDLALEEIPAPLIAAMAADMDARAPLAAMDIPLDCSTCGQQWTLLFDILSFFWLEIAAQARRLLREVHTLASHYGWQEADILAMSAVRRQFYLEMVT